MLFLIALLAVPSAWLGYEAKRSREIDGIVQAIERCGGYVAHDWDTTADGRLKDDAGNVIA